jgi:hypothetical protein
VNGDGTAPDFAHAPLHAALMAALLRGAHQTGPNQGDRQAILLSFALFVVSMGGTYLLGRCLFGGRSAAGRAIPLACLFFAFGGGALAAEVSAHPALLACLLFTLLLCALWRLDTLSAVNEPPRMASLWIAALAGALFGLLFLSLYSALLLLPALLFFLFRVAGRRWPAAIGFFLATAVLIASPLLARNFRLAHNPFYNAHFSDLVQGTTSFPADGLFGTAVAPRSLSQFMGGKGAGEVASKAAVGITGVLGLAPGVLGPLLLPLFLLAALTRFTDGRVNRLRALVYVCLACHVVGLAPFEPADRIAPLLLLYGPFAAVLSASFLLSLIQARNLPAFYARAATAGWTFVVCLPGLCQIVAPRTGPSAAPPYDVYDFLDATSPEMASLRASGAYFISDTPAEAAFRLGIPVVFLPADASDMLTVSQRTGRSFGAILLTPDIEQRQANDPYSGLWQTTYRQVIGLSQVAARLDAPMARSVVKSIKLFYPPQLAAGMRGFRPAPYPERGATEYSLLFWNPDAISGSASAPGKTVAPVK